MQPAEERIPNDSLDRLRDLHDRVDARAQHIASKHGDRLQCGRGCHGCCEDGLSVFEIEADRIRNDFADFLTEHRPNEAGGCAFLGQDGSCRIYEARPYVCRTQGLPLLLVYEDEQTEELEEHRDICPENAEGEDLSHLNEEDFWLIGPHELELAELQMDHSGSDRRVTLRSLFPKVSPAPLRPRR